jgi:hypothetical protein
MASVSVSFTAEFFNSTDLCVVKPEKVFCAESFFILTLSLACTRVNLVLSCSLSGGDTNMFLLIQSRKSNEYLEAGIKKELNMS